MDHPTTLPRDSAVRTANRTKGERLRKAKKDKKRKKQRKLRARERGEDTNSDDDDDKEEVADDIEWDNLENEDALTGIGSSLQASGPFPFYGGEGTSVELAEAGHTIGLP